MNNKVLVGIVAVIIVVAAAVAIGFKDDDNGSHGSDTVIIYNGNGGTSFDGQSVVESSSATISSMGFSNGDTMFLSWNTSADGTGTSYSNGTTVSATPGDPITLYAQWGYMFVVDFSSDVSSVLTPFFASSTISFEIDTYSIFNYIPASGEALIYIQSAVDMQWEFDGNNRFTAQNGNTEYVVTISSTGTDNVDYFINTHGYPTMTFDIIGKPTFKLDLAYHLI